MLTHQETNSLDQNVLDKLKNFTKQVEMKELKSVITDLIIEVSRPSEEIGDCNPEHLQKVLYNSFKLINFLDEVQEYQTIIDFERKR